MPRDTMAPESGAGRRVEQFFGPAKGAAQKKKALQQRIAAVLGDPEFTSRVRNRLERHTQKQECGEDLPWVRAALAEAKEGPMCRTAAAIGLKKGR